MPINFRNTLLKYLSWEIFRNMILNNVAMKYESVIHPTFKYIIFCEFEKYTMLYFSNVQTKYGVLNFPFNGF